MTIFRTAPELRPYSAEPWLCTLNSPSASTGKSVAGALARPPWLNEGCWRNESLLSTPSIKKILDFSRCPLTLNEPNDPRGVRGAAPGIRKVSLRKSRPFSGSRFTCRSLMTSASAALSRSICGDSSVRSEEHTSELQSRLHLVCRLLLEKKNRRKPGLQTLQVQAAFAR